MQKYYKYLIILGLSTFLLEACNKKESENKEAKGEAAEAKIDDSILKDSNPQIASFLPVNNELNLTGKITYNQDKVVKVFSLVSGHIEDVKSELGDYVKAGQVLAVIRSGDLADLEQQAVMAKSQLSIAQKNLQVAEDMTNGGLASQKELVAAREQLASAKGEVNRIAERKRIVGNSGSLYYVKSPVSGFIVEKTASSGMELRTDDPANLFTISNLDQVWVVANVYETDLANVHVGQEASITTISYADKVLTGKIDKIFNVLDPESKTMKVRITMQNPNYLLKPEMFANVRLIYGAGERKIKVPSSAVIFDNNQNSVVVRDEKNQLKVKHVQIFKVVGENTFVESGLNEGETVLSKNSLLIYNSLVNR